MIVQIGLVRQWFEYPGTTIPPEITSLTGITDADVAGTRIADEEAVTLINSTTLAIAHNASFDAPRLERRLPVIAGHPWACSCNEVAWPDFGFDGRKLGHLLMQQGMFHDGHRAAVDVWATVNLLGNVMPDGETALLKLVRQAGQGTIKVEATNSSFESKDRLKGRGYRWHSADKIWWNDLPAEREEEERAWLRDNCSCTQPKISAVTWHHRHRG